tara:strand:+ start:857 stop:1048 length:192 start_codon:yes stop_codon:yes gene_type:complete
MPEIEDDKLSRLPEEPEIGDKSTQANNIRLALNWDVMLIVAFHSSASVALARLVCPAAGHELN